MIANGLERASRATAIASKPTVRREARLGQVRDAEQLVRAGHPAQARRTSPSSRMIRRRGRMPAYRAASGFTPAVRISKPRVVR